MRQEADKYAEELEEFAQSNVDENNRPGDNDQGKSFLPNKLTSSFAYSYLPSLSY